MTAAIPPDLSVALFAGIALGCRRGGRAVFAGINFALGAGDALALTGPNGSGKSSLLRVMAGLLPPAAGLLRWQGAPVADEPEAHRARLAYLGHLDAVKPALSVGENLAFWIDFHAGDAGSRDAALERFDLLELADLPARYLSAGQRRRLALARIAAVPRPLWLLDEPSTGLDRESIAALEQAIAEHRAGGGIVVLSTHAALDLPGARALDLGADAQVAA
ncbi:MAG: heme ABC exporter ATP-binding protein CcmA [Alphaproteobacteria bacterium]|nr:heme ABC exporter ATP-binding protein CcmA [Alphaproteobacteria bacterium]